MTIDKGYDYTYLIRIMIILIAEAKTMSPCNGAVAEEEYAAHTPVLEARAAELVAGLSEMTAGELAERAKLSMAMAQKLKRMLYDFPCKTSGCAAMEAFTGVVFKAFGCNTLTDKEWDETWRRVRIVSSLYGWLRPDDIVKPYRFDYTSPVGPSGESLAKYWCDSVTECLLDEIVSADGGGVLNLLPTDAMRFIDWKRVEGVTDVWRAEFREVGEGGVMRTPNSSYLKKLRGELLRHIISERAETVEAIARLAGANFMGEALAADGSGTIRFVCTK